MKVSIKSTSKALALTLLFSSSAFAGSLARISSVKGNVFSLTNGKTQILKAGDEVQEGSEIVSEEGAQVSYSDFYDHMFHLSGSGQIALTKDKEHELRRGYIWVQSYNDNMPAVIKTANAFATFRKVEMILSFDNASGRTQVLAVTGNFDFTNLLETHLSRKIDAGNFSFVDNEYEQGMPRTPTLIGFNSYKKITGLFDGVKPQDPQAMNIVQNKAPESQAIPQQKEPIRVVATDSEAIKYFADKNNPSAPVPAKKMKMAKAKPGKPKEPHRNVKIYGLESEILETFSAAMPAGNKMEKRAPASVSEGAKVVQDEFENSLKQEYNKQTRHSSDVNDLIDQLKSYQSDYKKEY